MRPKANIQAVLLVLLVCVIAGCPIPMAPTMDDPSTSNDGNTLQTAIDIAVGSSMEASLDSSTDADWYRIVISNRGSGVIIIETRGSTDTVGGYYGPDGALLFRNDDQNILLNRNFGIRHDFTRVPDSAFPLTRYVRVTGFRNSTTGAVATGNYTLVVRYE